MLRLAILAAISLAVAAAPAFAQPPAPVPTPANPAPAAETPKPELDANGLVIKPGHDLVVRSCSTCHKQTIILSKHLDRSEWTELVYNMADRGAKATDEELAQIIDYLAVNYPREAAAKPTAAP